MILSASQPYYWPWLGYFDKIRRSDVFVILDNVFFSTKDNYVNRVQIRNVSPVKPVWMTIPVSKEGYPNKRIRDVEICNDESWQTRHWRQLEANYKNCKFWPVISELIRPNFYDRTFHLLGEIHILLAIAEAFFDIDVDKIEPHVSKRYDNLRGNEMLIALCKEYGADTFLFGKHGREYADEALFRKHGIKVEYQDYHPKIYKQPGGEFIPGLSVLDALFNVGIEETKRLI